MINNFHMGSPYFFICMKCHHRFEKKKKNSIPFLPSLPPRCPKCKSLNVMPDPMIQK